MRIEEAYSAWAPELTGYASALVGPHEAADVVADAFEQLLARPDRQWESVSDHRPYLFRCVLNAARMRRRSSGRRNSRQRRAAIIGAPQSATSGMAGEVLVDPAISAALRTLSIQQRAIAYFTYWEDLSIEQIAMLLGVGSGSVKKQLARARAKMREELS